MISRFSLSVIVFVTLLVGGVYAQQGGDVQPPTSQAQQTDKTLPDADVQNKLQDQVQDIGKTLDQSETVQEVSAGILQPIYQAAEYISFPMFYWIAFTLMVAGVVSFAGQLIFSKFFLLFRGSLNIKEIISDLLGFAISAVGLILTTQAATENSDFTTRPVSVVSAAAVGVVAGLVFYWWGQRQEFDAARGVKKADSGSRTGRGM